MLHILVQTSFSTVRGDAAAVLALQRFSPNGTPISEYKARPTPVGRTGPNSLTAVSEPSSDASGIQSVIALPPEEGTIYRHPTGFTGAATDDNGLVYLNARFYNPTNGLFLSRDPMAGSLERINSRNGFMYGDGNPARYADPSGLCRTDGSDQECIKSARALANDYDISYDDLMTADWATLALARLTGNYIGNSPKFRQINTMTRQAWNGVQQGFAQAGTALRQARSITTPDKPSAAQRLRC